MKKYFRLDYLMAVIFLSGAIVNGVYEEYQIMVADLVVLAFVYMQHLKDRIIAMKQERLDAQDKLIESLMELVDLKEEHNRIKDQLLNKN